MAAITSAAVIATFLGLTFLAWRRYVRVAETAPHGQADTCPYSLTEVFSDGHLLNVPHQQGVQWLDEIFSRSARRFPGYTALQIPHTGESLNFAELDARADGVAGALSAFLTGPDQVVAVAMAQDNPDIVAAHLGVLRAGGSMVLIDSALPDALTTHILEDARPVVVLTRGQGQFRDLPTLDVLALPANMPRCEPPPWRDDPTQRLATIFYTSGTTGMPKGVECPHAGFVNLALSYADYFDLMPGMDATSLTSSLGYDGSISEMYSAWVSGCAVVMLTREQMRSGPDFVPVLREAEVTVLFCPPVLLTTLTSTPELDLPYPVCRYVVPAGEAFPGTLVDPWTRGRRQIINTYGPTEASTDTSRQSLRPGESVTIGSPLANVTYVILEEGQLHPLPHGEVGELCIGGVHVARGYRNMPELTARQFITHPRFGRLYRTGDKCRIDPDSHRVHFLGRVDAQLKVRGRRVEVQAVEDMLQAQFGEIDAAVLDYQRQELVAFVAAPSVAEGAIPVAAPAPAEWAARVRNTLAAQLPEPSVPTRIFLVETFTMKPLSGKIDRDCLPRLSRLADHDEPDGEHGRGAPHADAPSTDGSEIRSPGNDPPVAPGCEQVLAICREVFEFPLDWDDVFVDNGGHSIVMAQLAQRLYAAGWAIPVRALLTDWDTPRKVTSRPRDCQPAAEESAPGARLGRGDAARDEAAAEVLQVPTFTTLQVLFLALLYAPPLAGFLGLVAFGEIGEFFITAHVGAFIGAGVAAYLIALVVPFAGLLWVMLIKRCMGGDAYINDVTPGLYPRWSRMHLRLWCIGRLQDSVLGPLGVIFRSAPLMAYVLRRLGARVGDNLQCAHGVEFSGPLDLLTIEDNVAIQTGAYVQLTRWVGRELHIGPVQLESGCKIGMRAAICGGVTVGRDARIHPFAPIVGDVGPGEMWEGAPARRTGRCTELKRTESYCRPAYPIVCMETLNILMQVFLDFWLLVVPTTAVTWFATSIIPVGEPGLAGAYFSTTPIHEVIWHMSLYAFVTAWTTIVLVSLLACLFVRLTPATPGLYPTRGLRAALLLYRLKKMNQVQRQWTWTIIGQYLRGLAGVRFTRVGASECDLMSDLVPELVSADAQVFWSNGCFTNMLDYGARHIVLRQLDMPGNAYISNNSVAEYGHLPSNFLLGVSTPGSDIRFRRQMQSRLGKPVAVAGNPPIRFASTETVGEDESRNLPGFGLFLGRVLINDVFSIGLLRIANVLAYVALFTGVLRLGGHPVVGAFIALMLTEAVLVVCCVFIKHALVGRQWGAAHSAPFWSWRHITYFFAQDCFYACCTIPLSFFAGTVLSNIILRRMGCRIGRHTIMASPLQAADWNAVCVGDDCMVAGFLQYHTMENMMLKVKRTDIRDGSTINAGATVMGGTTIEPGTTLLPLSMALKEMHLPSAVYEGSPAEPVGWGSGGLPAAHG